MALISAAPTAGSRRRAWLRRPAFNVNNLEQMRAIMEAADETDSPVIVQASAGARKYAGAPFLRHLILRPSKSSRTSRWSCTRTTAPRRGLPALDPARLQLGDDGRLPRRGRQDADQLRLQRRRHQAVVEMAHACGVSVEGELGCLGSLETGQAGEEDGIGAEGVLSTTSC
jgi:fructose-bisphosphate aldolase class II